MYELWETQELKDAIREIEEQLVPGIFSVSYTGGGFVQHVSPSEARETCRLMILALSKRKGFEHLNAGGRGRVVYIGYKDR